MVKLKEQWRRQDEELATKQAQHEKEAAAQAERHKLELDALMALHRGEQERWKAQERAGAQAISERILQLEKIKAELAQKSEENDVIRSEKETVTREIERLRKAFKQKEQAVTEMEELNTRHERETSQLEEKVQNLKRGQELAQNKEIELHQAIKEVQQLETNSSPQAGKQERAHKKVKQLRKELTRLKDKLEGSRSTANVLTTTNVQLTTEVNEAMKAAVKILEPDGKHPVAKIIEAIKQQRAGLPRSEIRVKQVGLLDKEVWQRAILGKVKKVHQARAEEFLTTFSEWEERIRKPEFDLWKTVPVPKEGVEPLLWERKKVVDEDNLKLKELRKKYPPEVAADVLEAMRLLDEHNPSGRYPVPMVWNHAEGRPATVAEILEKLMALLEATEGLQVGMAKGKKRMRARRGR